MTNVDRIDRRSFLKKSGLVGAATVGATALGASLIGLPEASAAAGSCRWGSCVFGRGNQSQMAAVKTLEQQIGRRFDVTHYRMPWATNLENQFTTWSANTGHTQLLSWFARGPGGLVSWRGIANGDRDAWITTQARTLRATGWKGFLSFHGEPEDEGTAADWKAAYNRVHTIFDNVGVTGFRWVATLMASTYSAGNAAPVDAAPIRPARGRRRNRYHCRGVPWKSFAQVFGGARNYAQAHEQEPLRGGGGDASRESRDARRRGSTARARPSRPGLRSIGFSYISENTDCNFWVDSTNSSLQSFAAMGHDPYFR